MRPQIPRELSNTPWEIWISDAPSPDNRASIDEFASAFRQWLEERPGHNANLTISEENALDLWLLRYEIDLLAAKIGETDLDEGGFLYSVVTLIGAGGGLSAALKLGLAASGVATATIAGGIALLGAVYSASNLLRNSRKRRRGRILEMLRRELRK